MLAVEKEYPPALPEVTEDPALDDIEPDPDCPEPDCIVIVCPPTVVDDVTSPFPTVTEDEFPVPAELVLSMTVQVVPSSSLTVSA